jgi:capsular exopolysaccharide synthesis family protein
VQRNGKPADKRLVSLLDPTSFEAEQYRQLRHRIEEFKAERGVRVIAVTSAVAGDGKTVTSINLASTLARGHGAKVLLIDADMRQPAVARTLGITSHRGGLSAALAGSDGMLRDFVQAVPKSPLFVLPTEVSGADAYEQLKSTRLAQLIDEARRHYDFVVIDTPPVIPVSDSVMIRRHIDGYLVVVSAGRTPRKLVGEALSMLDASAVLGLIFNRDARPLFGYYRGYYRSYFRNYVRAVNGHGPTIPSS